MNEWPSNEVPKEEGVVEEGYAAEKQDSTNETPKIPAEIVSFIEAVRAGKRVGANHNMGPNSMYGDGGWDSKPFEGYEYSHDRKELDNWEKILDPETYQYIKEIKDKYQQDFNIYYAGKTFQSPTTSTGRGAYYYWKEFPDSWVDYNVEDSFEYGVGEYQSAKLNIAMKMTTEERENYLEELESKYSSNAPQEKVEDPRY